MHVDTILQTKGTLVYTLPEIATLQRLLPYSTPTILAPSSSRRIKTTLSASSPNATSSANSASIHPQHLASPLVTA